MREKPLVLGFGFKPTESLHHFLVCFPEKSGAMITIYERFNWDEKADQQKIDLLQDKAKAEISRHKWKMMEDALQMEFNARLKKQKLPPGRFPAKGQIPLEKLLGKELLLLVWAVEDCDPSVIETAIRNWRGLSPEERWWLFTMTNAASGGIGDRRGWRKAIRYALSENPINEVRQMSLFDSMIKKGQE